MSPLEAALEGYFRTRVQRLGGMVEKVVPVRAGMPDRMVLIHGKVLLVELKTDTGKLRPAQELWHMRAAERGVQVTVLSGKEQIDAWLRALVQEHDPKPRKSGRKPGKSHPTMATCHTCEDAKSFPSEYAAEVWASELHAGHSIEMRREAA